ncbi:hypothetical protein BGZ49_009646 [Haplosporangium sp. Z 27]|nr:hypothetical protein BGZ49_009646 [Haplosporangium sp. Z 27]
MEVRLENYPLTQPANNGWEKAVKEVNSVGKRAWLRERNRWQDSQRIAREQGLQVTNRSEPRFSEVKEDVIWRVLMARISSLEKIRQAGSTLEAPEDRTNTEMQPKWIVQDPYQGHVKELYS